LAIAADIDPVWEVAPEGYHEEQTQKAIESATTPPSTLARKAAEEIAEWADSIFPPTSSGPFSKEGRRFKIEGILARHFNITSDIARAAAVQIKRDADDQFAMPVPDEPTVSQWTAIIERCFSAESESGAEGNSKEKG
jgi:hypothetical protein